VRGIESLISYSLYSIVPTLDRGDAGAVHPGDQVRRLVRLDHHSRAGAVHRLHRQRHEWRTKFRKEANEFDSAAHTKAVDSLLNYETGQVLQQ
jgi:ATP-binding cassette subfamily B protein